MREDAKYRINTILIEETNDYLKFWHVNYNDLKSNGSSYFLDYFSSSQLTSGSPDFFLYINDNEVLIAGNVYGVLTFLQTSTGKSFIQFILKQMP